MTVRRRPSPRTVLAIASLGGVIAFVDATIVNIAFPDITRSFPDAPVSSLSWVLNAYNVVFAAFLIAGAGMAESLGRRRVFVVGLELFTVGSLLCAVAPSAGALIAFRVVQALGAALLVPSALALVLQAFEPARRSHAVALLSAVSAAADGAIAHSSEPTVNSSRPTMNTRRRPSESAIPAPAMRNAANTTL